jgi:hypothetical protein
MNSARLRPNLLGVMLTLLGCAQLVGYLSDSQPLRSAAAASAAAPLPSVFADPNGAGSPVRAMLVWRMTDGEEVRLPITPELFAAVAAPDALRQSYAALLSPAANWPSSLVAAARRWALVGPDARLARALGVPAEARVLRLEFTPLIASQAVPSPWVADSAP